MTRRRELVAVLLGVVLMAAAAPSEPAGYRTEDYQAATPLTLAGAQVLSTDQAYALWEGGAKQWQNGGAVFVDVLPQAPRPAGLPPGTIWRPKPREDIPGSIWLPDVGYGELAPVMRDYFEHGLQYATGSDPSRLLIFYCRDMCWHSWNAAKRAVALGYRVAWYREGTDGWAAAGHPLELREPVPRPDVSLSSGPTG